MISAGYSPDSLEKEGKISHLLLNFVTILNPANLVKTLKAYYWTQRFSEVHFQDAQNYLCLHIKRNFKRIVYQEWKHQKSHQTQQKQWWGRLQCIKKIISEILTLPHSAQTCTRGPCVCKCFRIAELSRNIFVQPCKNKDNHQGNRKKYIIQYANVSKTVKRTQTGYQSIIV